MKKRILRNWTFSRFLILLAGTGLILFSVYDGMWPGILLGVYVLSMAIFDFGCTGKFCQGNSCENSSFLSRNTQ